MQQLKKDNLVDSLYNALKQKKQVSEHWNMEYKNTQWNWKATSSIERIRTTEDIYNRISWDTVEGRRSFYEFQ